LNSPQVFLNQRSIKSDPSKKPSQTRFRESAAFDAIQRQKLHNCIPTLDAYNALAPGAPYESELPAKARIPIKSDE
jgi:hypothetical protein